MFRPKIDRISYGGAVIGLEEVQAIMNVILSNGGRFWTLGAEAKAFEEELAEVAGVKYSVVVNSGSSALMVAMAALKLPKASKILVPACNFPTAINSIIQNGHIPVVIDSDLKTLNLSLAEVGKALKMYPEIAAVVAVDIAGNPVDLIKLRKIVGSRKIILDNCDGFGTKIEGKMIEEFADVSCASFHAAHIITTGEGGAIFTNETNIAETAVKLRDWGRAAGTDKIYDDPEMPEDYKERYVYEEIGWNLKPLELQCAMGRIQLKKLGTFRDLRRKNYEALKKIFKKFADKFEIISKSTGLDAQPCWFSFPILVKMGKRGSVVQFLEENNIECRTIFAGNILKHPAYRDVEIIKIGDLKNADIIMRDGMFLSCHPLLTQEMIDFIERVVEEF